ncbi:phosphotransferase enzyme family protein [Streptomyces sp. NBC_00470]|uniref:phosphotransferase enzyme family protein n=1 Tax=Streptomyces sp. NBC_00470 TaxID=2975753 RepID=UPI0030DE75B3
MTAIQAPSAVPAAPDNAAAAAPGGRNGEPPPQGRMTLPAQPALDAEQAAQVLRIACRRTRLEPGRLAPIRLGDHAVFRLERPRLVARVTRSPGRLPGARRETALASWLAGTAYPAARLHNAIKQPVVVDHHAVTFWEDLGADAAYAATGDMGRLLHQLHGLTAPPFPLPALRPFATLGRRLARAELPPETRTFLRDRIQHLEAAYNSLEFTLPSGHLHGDFNVGNVLVDPTGHPTVIDLDGFVTGPREWDLVPAAIYFDTFGWHTRTEYTAFADGYGCDVRTWSGYPTLRSIHELLMITWLAQSAGSDPRAAAEVARRTDTLRTGACRRTWQPF